MISDKLIWRIIKSIALKMQITSTGSQSYSNRGTYISPRNRSWLYKVYLLYTFDLHKYHCSDKSQFLMSVQCLLFLCLNRFIMNSALFWFYILIHLSGNIRMPPLHYPEKGPSSPPSYNCGVSDSLARRLTAYHCWDLAMD